MNTITWIDRTNYRNAPSHRGASIWDVTIGAKTYRVERAPAAYHLWDGLDWLGMYVAPVDVEAAITAHAPAEEAAPEPETGSAADADIIKAFEAKANEVAKANGWTISRAETVMLRYLRDTSPAEAATIAAALQSRMTRAA